MKRILVVDDEPQITRMLRTSLQSSGYEVLIAHNGVEAHERVLADRPDLIITDLAMPEMNGLELTKAVRRVATMPIIVLSVRASDSMKVMALDEGADDYLTKPFSMPELLARVRAQLRRVPEVEKKSTHFEVGDFVVDAEKHSVSVCGQATHLTPKEFDLLLLFVRSPERVLTHKVLLRAVWGPAGDNQPEYLRVLVAGLRKKLEREGKKYVWSEPWVGYRFSPSGLILLLFLNVLSTVPLCGCPLYLKGGLNVLFVSSFVCPFFLSVVSQSADLCPRYRLLLFATEAV